MNISKILLLTSDFASGITPPTNTKHSITTIAGIILTILLIALLVIIFCLCLSHHDKTKKIKLLEEKCCPVIFTNNETNDIIVISNDNYTEISIEVSLYDENNNLQKQYILKEYNFELNEQRKISNIENGDNYKVKYKISEYKRKEEI